MGPSIGTEFNTAHGALPSEYLFGLDYVMFFGDEGRDARMVDELAFVL